ncbi:hypothetical protein GOACH_25_00330 [Gordonia aichiensis NBRC 108223]|uniref:UspA domain-containing protein n=2 Tax=Gordonia aichiensis TaxID=36820 RepID=L7KRD9_9ACTN|nr:universal stress protein [Gordonia aichiensis]GAC50497.1 hypothetical protein GOACH_25_00330 [Gordonia aichiensis NBRC 108223]
MYDFPMAAGSSPSPTGPHGPGGAGKREKVTSGEPDHGQTLMIAYDGSPNADRAIRYAAHFLRARMAHVVTAWEPGAMSAPRVSSLAAGMQPYLDTRAEIEVDEALEREAVDTNARGVALATECGLQATGTLVEADSTVWAALISAADSLDVDLLVTGTRGATGFKALLRSSVAERVLKHCHRPVFVVPAKCESQPRPEITI